VVLCAFGGIAQSVVCAGPGSFGQFKVIGGGATAPMVSTGHSDGEEEGEANAKDEQDEDEATACPADDRGEEADMARGRGGLARC